jgi:hypothetical protein
MLLMITATLFTSCNDNEPLPVVTPSFVLANTNFAIKAGEKKELLRNGRYTLVFEGDGTLSIYLLENAKVRSLPIFYAEYFTKTVPSNATPFEFYWQFYGEGLIRTTGYWYNGTKNGAYIYSGAIEYVRNHGYYKLSLTPEGKLQFLYENGKLGKEM